MKLADASHGPDWVVWVLFILFAVLPMSFVYIAFGIVVVDCIAIIVAANTICKK